jgi:hypothetical protein
LDKLERQTRVTFVYRLQTILHLKDNYVLMLRDTPKTRSTAFHLRIHLIYVCELSNRFLSRTEPVWRQREKKPHVSPKDTVDGSPASPSRVRGQTDAKKQHQEENPTIRRSRYQETWERFSHPQNPTFVHRGNQNNQLTFILAKQTTYIIM